MGIYLVTAATGAQGSAVVRQLVKAGHTVRCLVRDPAAPKAKALQGGTVSLVRGDFASTDAIEEAARGCDGVFLNTQPGPDEVEQAHNVLGAVKKAGVPLVVAATVTRAEEHEMFTVSTDSHLPYWQRKAAVQRAIADAGIPSWTILQPAWIMTNYIAPNAAMFWPELKEQGVLLASVNAETKIQLIDPEDMGAFAAAALTDTDRTRWNHKLIRMASDELTMAEIAQVMGSVTGKRVVVKFRPSEEIEELANTSPFVWSQRWTRDHGTQVDIQRLRGYNLPLSSFREFLERNEAAIKEAV